MILVGRFAKGEEHFGRNKISAEEANEFLRIIQQNEFKIIEQLNKTPARVSLLELLMSFEPHQALLVKILNEAHVAQDISVEGFGGIINNITTPWPMRRYPSRVADIIGPYMCSSNVWTHYGQGSYRQRLVTECHAQKHVGQTAFQHITPQDELHGGASF